MKTVVTHNSAFHPDDVFAVAVLQLVYGKDNIQIERTRDEERIAAADIVVDVGAVYESERSRFDHHQPGAPVRDMGIPYAAFGLVWKEFGEKITTPYAADVIERVLVRPIDAGDNGVSLYSVNELGTQPAQLYAVISSYVPVREKTEVTYYEAFLEAVDFAREYLVRLIKKYEADEESYQKAKALWESADDKTILISDEPINREHVIECKETLVLVTPKEGSADNWRAYAIPVDRNTFVTRVQFPLAWRGLRGEELEAVSSISGAEFCHKNGFMFVCRTKEGAIEAARKAVG
ncbi:MAG: hypothetical protein RLZZ480_618 [Candidatus Parcubacteria bacterium]|jgi:uncharacterized UPF0160 family protein